MATETKITITLDPGIRHEAAERIVYESHPGYNSMVLGTGYTDGKEIWIASATRPWDPWPVGTEVVMLRNLIGPDVTCAPIFETASEWKSAYPDRFAEWETAYQAETGEEPQPYEVLAWARDNRAAEVEEIEREQEELAVDFAEGEMAENVEITYYEEGDSEVTRRW